MDITTERIVDLWNDFCNGRNLYTERLRTEDELFNDFASYFYWLEADMMYLAMTCFLDAYNRTSGDYYIANEENGFPEVEEAIWSKDIFEYIDSTRYAEDFQEYLENHID